MLFDQRVRAKLRDAGLDRDTIRQIEDEVAEEARDEADRIESFFDGVDTVYSDMDRTHSSEEFPEHTVDYVDLFTHSEDIRGYLRFDTWGVYVEGGRVLRDEESGEEPPLVELSLGPTVHDRVRFSTDREAL
ncbi:DUF7532 family protein [Halospeciosus flavus]|uniref:Uncharacterized protein n=1 Tax=Halospeciosus flavus TaxID=3032283 RepID=A0ABD5Z5R2_9EURY|nr:hypothetical protein [Halospeciosus flavus]